MAFLPGDVFSKIARSIHALLLRASKENLAGRLAPFTDRIGGTFLPVRMRVPPHTGSLPLRASCAKSKTGLPPGPISGAQPAVKKSRAYAPALVSA